MPLCSENLPNLAFLVESQKTRLPSFSSGHVSCVPDKGSVHKFGDSGCGPDVRRAATHVGCRICDAMVGRGCKSVRVSAVQGGRPIHTRWGVAAFFVHLAW